MVAATALCVYYTNVASTRRASCCCGPHLKSHKEIPPHPAASPFGACNDFTHVITAGNQIAYELTYLKWPLHILFLAAGRLLATADIEVLTKACKKRRVASHNTHDTPRSTLRTGRPVGSALEHRETSLAVLRVEECHRR